MEIKKVPATNLTQALDDFEREFTKGWQNYMKLHQKLDEYRGIDLKDHFEEVNGIIALITSQILDLHPSFEFILKRTKMCNDAIKHYNDFIETIKMAGGTEAPDVTIQ